MPRGRVKSPPLIRRYVQNVSDPTPPPADVFELSERLADAERRLDELRVQLMESQRLAAIGTVAAVIAHEFNNLLTPVVSYAQYALSSAESDAPDMALIKKALAKAYKGSTKAGRVCSSMLGLARGEGEPSVVCVRTLVEETLLVLARDPQKDGIALRVQVQPGLHAVGDPIQFEQVLLNLLINARHAMLGRGGSLTVKASGFGGEARLQVIDTGPGIPPEIAEQIFEPFFTTKRPGQSPANVRRRPGSHEEQATGSGLGLAVCKEIVERHGGRISVTSAVGRGTTFDVYLPLADADAGVSAEAA